MVASPDSDPVFSGLSPLGDLTNLEPSPLLDQRTGTGPVLEAGEALLSSIHHSAGETLYNLLQQAGMQAPQSWTMHELAAEIIDAQGDLCVRSF